MNEEKDIILEAALSTTILMQILCNELEILPPSLSRKKVKKLSNELIRELSPIIETYFNRMFFTDEEITQTITGEYEELVKLIAKKGIQSKVFMKQALHAHSIDYEKAESVIQDIIINQ